MRAKFPRVLLGACAVCLLWAIPSNRASTTKDLFARQENAPRVIAARARVESQVRGLFAKKGIAYPPPVLLLRVFKAEGELELWAGKHKNASLAHVKTYAICKKSGTLGPKRRQGDRQVPEGFYEVDVLNPMSNFHLSLRINYPNRSDVILGRKQHSASLGGEIYLHGDCVTIGCIPLKDGPIEEIYVAALDVHKAGGGPVKVHIFPARLTDHTFAVLRAVVADQGTLAFWRNLKQGFDAFAANHRIPTVTVSQNGRYHFAATRR